MPTYAYECSACAHRLEEFQSMSAAPLKKCPACKKQKLQRLIGSGAGVIFKGSGFYQTDYKNAGSGDKKGKGGEPTKKDADAANTTDKPAPADKAAQPTGAKPADKPADRQPRDQKGADKKAADNKPSSPSTR